MSQAITELHDILRRHLATKIARKAVVDADILARDEWLADLRTRADEHWWKKWTGWMEWWVGEFEWRVRESGRLGREIAEIEKELAEEGKEEQEKKDGGEDDGSCDMEISDGEEVETGAPREGEAMEDGEGALD